MDTSIRQDNPENDLKLHLGYTCVIQKYLSSVAIEYSFVVMAKQNKFVILHCINVIPI